jgi:hypothetical protein
MRRHDSIVMLAVAVVVELGVAPRHLRADAQAAPIVRGVIVEPGGRPIAFAQIRGPGVDPRISDDAGRFSITMRKAGPLSLQLRRVGFRPLETRDTVTSDTTLTFVMDPVAASLETVRIELEATVQSLEFHGFYDRLRDHVKGTNTGYFIMPEEIEQRRGASKASQLVQGIPNVRVMSIMPPKGSRGETFETLVGPGGCPMTIFIDGVRLNRMDKGMGAPAEFDHLVSTRELAGVEVYTHAHVPAQFQAFALNCGVVLFWTR